MQVHINPFAQATVSRYFALSNSPVQKTVVRGVRAECAIEQGLAFPPEEPLHTADADSATLRFSFATADVGNRALIKSLGVTIKVKSCNFKSKHTNLRITQCQFVL